MEDSGARLLAKLFVLHFLYEQRKEGGIYLKHLNVVKETFLTSLPLIAIIFAVIIFVAPFENHFDYVRVLIGYVGVVLGQALFLIGLNTSILPIGESIGKNLVKLKKVVWIILCGLLFGLLAEVAEPSIAVFARQTHILINEVHETLFIWSMGAGIGVFVAFALWRVVKNFSIKLTFIIWYGILFAMAFIVPIEFVALAFDGSGATTGDISVPFILALGMGVSLTLSNRKDNSDIFGIVGIASIGPILAIFIYGIVLSHIHGGIPPVGAYDPGTAFESVFEILRGNLRAVLIAVVPMIVVFLPFQFWLIKLPKKDVKRILLGSIPVMMGLFVFLSAIDYGFAFTGEYVGSAFLDSSMPEWFRWLLLPVAFVLGAAITLTEPAVTVLRRTTRKDNGQEN